MTDKIKNRFSCYTIIVTILLLNSFAISSAQNYIYVKSTSKKTASVELQNLDLIVGLQFTIHSSPGILLKSIEKEMRFSDATWLVASNVKNESTLTVVAINSRLEELNPGTGSIIKINFENNIQTIGEEAVFRLSEIILSDKNGKSVPVTTINEITDNRNNLLQNYPNPFNSVTTISYSIESTTHVQLAIYDIAGRVVKTLVDEIQSAGNHSVVWNSTNTSNQEVASGTYFYQLLVNGKATVKKLILQK